MKVKDLIKKLQEWKPKLQDKEIVVVAENRTYQEPHIRLEQIESQKKSNINYTFEIKRVILYWE